MNPKPLHQNTCTPRIFFHQRALHQKPLQLQQTIFAPKSFTPHTVYTRSLFLLHELHERPFCTTSSHQTTLHQGTFTFSSVCTKEPPKSFYTKTYQTTLPKPEAHQRALTPRDFCTRRFLHHFDNRIYLHQKKIDQKSFPTRTICTRGTSHQRLFDLLHPKPLQQKIFIPQRFYTKQFLNQNASTPETFFANELVHGGDTSKSFPTKKNCATANSWNWKARSYLAVQKHTPYTTAAAKCKAKNDCACQHHPKPSEKSTRTSAALETQWNHTPQHESAQPWIAKLNAASVHSNTHTQTMLPWSANIQWRSPPRPNIACYKVITLMPAAKFSYVRTTRSHRKLATT